jgi:hypothetical protein
MPVRKFIEQAQNAIENDNLGTSIGNANIQGKRQCCSI